jgi:hypothetical protein
MAEEKQRELDRANQAIAEALSSDLDFGEDGGLLSPRVRNALWRLTLADKNVKKSYLLFLLNNTEEMLRAAQAYARVSRAIGLRTSEYEEKGDIARAAAELQRLNNGRIRYQLVDGLKSTIRYTYKKLDDKQRKKFFNEYLKFVLEANDKFEVQGLSDVLLTITPQLAAQQTHELTLVLVERIVATADERQLRNLVDVLIAIEASMSEAEARRVARVLLDRLGQTSSPYEFDTFGKTLASLPHAIH